MASATPRKAPAATKASGRAAVKSCLRAIEVIEYFTTTDGPARTIEISEALGIPNSSADEILRTLGRTGYLSYDHVTKKYSPSYKLIAKARRIEEVFFGGDVIHEILEDATRQTGATAFVTMQNDCWVENVGEVRGEWRVAAADVDFPTEMLECDNYQWRPATNFAAVMLAQHSNIEVIELARRAQRFGLGPQGPSMMKELVDRVARTRARGFAVCRRSDSIHLESIAVPFWVPRSAAPYAVGLVGERLCADDAGAKAIAATLQKVICRHSSGRLHRSTH